MSGAVAGRIAGSPTANWFPRSAALLEHAKQRAGQWQADGDEAIKYGNEVWAKECYARSKYWNEEAKFFEPAK
jgi:hypothetical protein